MHSPESLNTVYWNIVLWREHYESFVLISNARELGVQKKLILDLFKLIFFSNLFSKLFPNMQSAIISSGFKSQMMFSELKNPYSAVPIKSHPPPPRTVGASKLANWQPLILIPLGMDFWIFKNVGIVLPFFA